MKKLVLKSLSDRRAISIEEITEKATSELKDEITEILEKLDNEGKASYKPTDGGWVKE